MAFLSILFLLFSFVLFGVGSGSNGTSSLPTLGSTSSTSTGCVVVTWRKGHAAHKGGCRSAASRRGVVHHRAMIKCSGRMMADGQTRQPCGPPPANP
jgi:hypothetical protein